ncbi:MAG: hypothetical protein E6R03_04860 [Hyphomicrobiaceae bacterium]|jgi:hypothetical protein|nr:MAG: hypothetical protein E6R03_04860 [Hyphomicrobiaceae bacterium]
MPRTEKKPLRYDRSAWVCVYVRPGSDVLQMTSNLADAEVAQRYGDTIERSGGRVVAVTTAGELGDVLRGLRK